MHFIPRTHSEPHNPSSWSRSIPPFDEKHAYWLGPVNPGVTIDPSMSVPTQQYFLTHKSMVFLGQVPEVCTIPIPEMPLPCPKSAPEMFAFPEPARQNSRKQKRRWWKKVLETPFDILKWIGKKWFHPSDECMRVMQLTSWCVVIVTAIIGCIITLVKVC